MLFSESLKHIQKTIVFQVITQWVHAAFSTCPSCTHARTYMYATGTFLSVLLHILCILLSFHILPFSLTMLQLQINYQLSSIEHINPVNEDRLYNEVSTVFIIPKAIGTMYDRAIEIPTKLYSLLLTFDFCPVGFVHHAQTHHGYKCMIDKTFLRKVS